MKKLCATECSACTGPLITQCKSCVTGNYLFGTECRGTCPDRFYENSLTNECMNCVGPCNTCSTLTDCETCLTGFFFNSGTFRCNACLVKNCGDCLSDINTCTTCKTGFRVNNSICICDGANFELNGNCLAACPAGYFKDTATQSCLRCPF
jgi:proprotein convertase subtilisin/kexin type 5